MCSFWPRNRCMRSGLHSPPSFCLCYIYRYVCGSDLCAALICVRSGMRAVGALPGAVVAAVLTRAHASFEEYKQLIHLHPVCTPSTHHHTTSITSAHHSLHLCWLRCVQHFANDLAFDEFWRAECLRRFTHVHSEQDKPPRVSWHQFHTVLRHTQSTLHCTNHSHRRL